MEDLCILESGIKRKAEKHNCEFCGEEFLRRKNASKPKKYCSKKCHEKSCKKRVIVKCANCGLNKPKFISLKTGYLKYCCNKCGIKQSKAKGREVKVEVHHKEGILNWEEIYEAIRKNLLCDPDLLEVLCKECHASETYGHAKETYK